MKRRVWSNTFAQPETEDVFYYIYNDSDPSVNMQHNTPLISQVFKKKNIQKVNLSMPQGQDLTNVEILLYRRDSVQPRSLAQRRQAPSHLETFPMSASASCRRRMMV